MPSRSEAPPDRSRRLPRRRRRQRETSEPEALGPRSNQLHGAQQTEAIRKGHSAAAKQKSLLKHEPSSDGEYQPSSPGKNPGPEAHPGGGKQKRRQDIKGCLRPPKHNHQEQDIVESIETDEPSTQSLALPRASTPPRITNTRQISPARGKLKRLRARATRDFARTQKAFQDSHLLSDNPEHSDDHDFRLPKKPHLDISPSSGYSTSSSSLSTPNWDVNPFGWRARTPPGWTLSSPNSRSALSSPSSSSSGQASDLHIVQWVQNIHSSATTEYHRSIILGTPSPISVDSVSKFSGNTSALRQPSIDSLSSSSNGRRKQRRKDSTISPSYRQTREWQLPDMEARNDTGPQNG